MLLRVLRRVRQLVRAGTHPIGRRLAGWIRPATSSSLVLGAAADLARSKPQLIAENAKIYGLADPMVDQMFAFLVRDFGKFGQQLHAKPSSTPAQMACCLRLIHKPVFDAEGYQAVWNEVHGLSGVYEMRP